MLSDSHSRIEVYVQRNKRNNSFEVQTMTTRLYLVLWHCGNRLGPFFERLLRFYCAIRFNTPRVIWLCERLKRYVQLIIAQNRNKVGIKFIPSYCCRYVS